MTDPQPMKLRRGGAKRGDHGSYVATEPQAEAGPPTPADDAPAPEPSRSIGTDTPRSVTRTRRVGKSITPAGAAAKAAYDAKPKVIFRGVDEDVYYKLRAIYKHQLRSADGDRGMERVRPRRRAADLRRPVRAGPRGDGRRGKTSSYRPAADWREANGRYPSAQLHPCPVERAR